MGVGAVGKGVVCVEQEPAVGELGGGGAPAA